MANLHPQPAAEESTPDVSSADQEETEQAQQSTLTYENDFCQKKQRHWRTELFRRGSIDKGDSVTYQFRNHDTVSQKLAKAADR